MAEVMLVTGGARGIGSAIAVLAARRGYEIALTYANDARAASETCAAIEREGVRALAIKQDSAADGAADSLFDQVSARLGPVTALVNNAGITGGIGRFETVSEATMRAVVEVNLMMPMLLSQSIVRQWIGNGTKGRIVNISSVAATTGSPGEYIPYAAAKAGLETFSRGLAREVAAHGIRVNAVAPGTTDTGIHAAGGDPDRPARVAKRIPMGRVGKREEIAQAVLWLLSAEADYVTGETLTVAGGL